MFLTTSFTTFMTVSVVLAQGPKAWGGNCVSPLDTNVATVQGFECIFSNIVSVVTLLVGLAVFVMLVTGGFKYLTSGGDAKAQEQAKGTMTYAVLGLVLIIAAYLILKFISNFTGVQSLLNFTIPGP